MTSQSRRVADEWGRTLKKQYQKHCGKSRTSTLVSLVAQQWSAELVGGWHPARGPAYDTGTQWLATVTLVLGNHKKKNHSPGVCHCYTSIISPSSAYFCYEATRTTAKVAACLTLCIWSQWRNVLRTITKGGTLHREYGSEELFQKLLGHSRFMTNFPNILTKWPADESLSLQGYYWSSWLCYAARKLASCPVNLWF